VVYQYTPDRGIKYTAAVLDGFAGIIQTDRYVVCKSRSRPTITNVRNNVLYCFLALRKNKFWLPEPQI
jgi:transposase IS66 family protein